MKKVFAVLAVSLFALTSCGKKAPEPEKVNKELIEAYWDPMYEDYDNEFYTIDSVRNAKSYIDGVESNMPTATSFLDKDIKHVFFGKNNRIRVANLAEGYMFTTVGKKMDLDATLSQIRTKYYTENSVLTVTSEYHSPYGDTPNGWNTYFTEWFQKFIGDPEFINANDLEYIQEPDTTVGFKNKYFMYSYDIEITCDDEGDEQLEHPFYHIRALRPMDSYVEFTLFVLKSKIRDTSEIDTIVNSFWEFDPIGVQKNLQQEYDLIIPEYWSDETKAYYNLLQTQNHVDWGFFSYSMPSDTSSDYNGQGKKITSEMARLKEAFEIPVYDILPTYTHIGWWPPTSTSRVPNYFPNKMAKALAGGNGFNDKPVLQFTYQFTTYNNVNLQGYTPMFDVMKVQFDYLFRAYARDIKAYKKPVLFRLNNEMNTDWTSYCGMVTLLDPDIFIQTWKRMYDIFVEEGVNNCIWIWNPMANDAPHSNWSYHVNFFPGPEYVQVLGLTSYEMGNDAKHYRSFEEHYEALYARNNPYFVQYPGVISEFAGGAGGEVVFDYDSDTYVEVELARNQEIQATYVKEMFELMNLEDKSDKPWLEQIKGAVWFSCNDYAQVPSKDDPEVTELKISNYLKLDETLTSTLEQFKIGFANRVINK